MASGQNNESKLSFGVEMEFYIFWARGAIGSAPTPEGFESRPGGPLYIHSNSLTSRLRDLVKSLPAATVVPPSVVIAINDSRNADVIHLRHYREWYTENDLSLDIRPPELEAMRGPNSGWVGVEVVSPALWANDEGFSQVRKVCEFIQNTFWTSTPPSAGLHIHVGNGKEYFPVQSLRQIAAFLYAADPILAQSHPKHRHENGFCPSLRLFSKLSLGIKKSGLSAPPEQLNKRTNSPSSRLRSFFQNIFRRSPPHSKPTRNTEERKKDRFPPRPKKGVYAPNSERDPEDQRTSVFEAVAALMEETTREGVSILMTTNSMTRLGYNFHDPTVANKRTIEFRRPASSLDPAEVVAQARIAVALCEFAANPDQEQFQKIILDCDTADEYPSWYDVYDLFIDLNLRPEARVIHAALKGTLDDSVRAEYWKSR
ncbi:putative amidoligase enzyme-domain-containing protein [Hypoxylon sp. FL0890]|nr:putative amidoligase enzyme-domain-containing protein [Hypoxylon sp. FL0890]